MFNKHRYSEISFWLIINFQLLLHINATPLPKEPSSGNTHIISFVAQRKTNVKHAEINDFDFESFGGNTSLNEKYFAMNGAIKQLFGRLITTPRRKSLHRRISENLQNFRSTDDLFNSSENTLESTNNQLAIDTQHESSSSSNNSNGIGFNEYHHRFKQSIPVLEPVRHLLNSVREGHFNHSTHFNHSVHHLFNPGDGGGGMRGNGESSAIETMADRETAENSVSFNVLDFLGRVGGKIWNFLMMLFAASSSNASAASSSGGSL